MAFGYAANPDTPHHAQVSNFAQTPSSRVSRIYFNATPLARSTKVRIFPCGRHNYHRYGGIVLGLHPHLDDSACGRLVHGPNRYDCGHGAFFHHRVANDWVGRVIGVLTLTPYDFWRRTHAIHHSTSSNLDGRGTGDVHRASMQRCLMPLAAFMSACG
jgi:hypothetical protein